jgi:Fe-S-cluster containining protein
MSQTIEDQTEILSILKNQLGENLPIFQKTFENAIHVFRSLVGIKPSLKKAVIAQSLVDQSIDVAKFKVPEFKPTCRAGCSACCHKMIDITESEAMLISEAIKRKIVTIDFKKLKKQSNFIKNNTDDDDVWVNQAKADSKCVFVDDSNNCSIYKIRPNACRSYFVASDPSLCDVNSEISTNVIIIPTIILTAGSVSVDEKMRPMPVALIKQLKKDEVDLTQ